MSYAPANLLFATLPQELRFDLMGLLKPVVLPIRTVLFESQCPPPKVHFLTSGLASIVTYMKDGQAVEAGLVGYEGVPESLHLLGPARIETDCFMQIGGTGLEMKFKDFERLFQREEVLRSAILRFVQYQNLVLGQLAACNRFHEVEERLARWLLMVSDRIGHSELRVTQEFASRMLGTRRSTITLVAGTLAHHGLIEYSRGYVRILDREGLEGAACECYRITYHALQRLIHHATPPTLNPYRDLRQRSNLPPLLPRTLKRGIA